MIIDRRSFAAGLLAAGLAPGVARAEGLPMPDPRGWDPAVPLLDEGNAAGPNGTVYYRTYGPPGTVAAVPVVVLHGGPAAGHRYMRPYAALGTDRRVVLYDQSGCGRSAKPADLSRYTVDAYVAELEALRTHLGFPRMILVGHSWGGMLAPAYASAHPDRVAGLVLAGTARRWRDFSDAAARWLKDLGPAAVRTARTGKPGEPAYDALTATYYAKHLCRLDPPPAWFEAEGATIAKNPVYAYLNGPTEFDFRGALAGLDLTPRLKRLRMPTLVTCGEYDEAPPWVAQRLAALVPGARVEVFAGCSHMAHIEDPPRVVATTAAFVRGVG